MTWNYSINYVSAIAADQPANADDINTLFSDIENELSGVNNIADDAVTTSKIVDGAVTETKIDLSGFTPTDADDPITKSWYEAELQDGAADFYRINTVTTKDSGGTNNIVGDVYDVNGPAITQKVYRAQTDGYLVVTTRVMNDSSGAVQNDVNGRLTIWAHSTSVVGYTWEGVSLDTPSISEWDWDAQPINSGAFIRFDRGFRGGPVSACVPIKKNEYFKIAAIKDNKGNANGSYERMETMIRWIGLGSNLAPALQ